MTVVRVETPPRGYDVLIGPVEAGIERVAGLGGRAVMVSEPRVFALHGDRLATALGTAPILLPEGEAAKDWATLHRLMEQLAERNVGRDTPIVALGGGAVGDVAGLAAALFKRGCPIVHIPTTLLSQADSAIGGKTAIDAFGEKNLIGAFHQPALVIVDPALLDTLDPRQLRSGYAEVVKYGLIDDPAFFAWCEAEGRGVLAGHCDLRNHAIETAIRAKARIVAADVEDRNGQRALLNLGHSFGHAIESEAGIGALLHGEAVALGMALAFRLSAELGHCPATDAARVVSHLGTMGLPTQLGEVGLSGRGGRLIEWMARDKKNASGQLVLVLAHGVGRAFVDRSVDRARLAAYLDR
ncbi:MAG: 3-dehydroquinate synthase [Sphingomonas sp.]|uniref:3-dehydroquinate synthase n=1 Tax=Sphingomonas sp. TaxID=28214 RepID=UPI0017BF43DC|nr:3-dehydroquinate synthase [Sphingomonas sp.]MBA3667260.1 3-dehydroquinate synthase [Sphingomonas sp.]